MKNGVKKREVKEKKTYFNVERVNFTNGWIGAGLVVDKETKQSRIGFRIVKQNSLQYWLDFSREEAYALIKCLTVALAADEQIVDKKELFDKITGLPTPNADSDKVDMPKPEQVEKGADHGTGESKK